MSTRSGLRSSSGAALRTGAALIGVVLSVLTISVGPAGSAASHARALATPADWALFFLKCYERPDGRVVRIDQGGDTVSEGQAYAMLLALALGDRQRFAAAWSWASKNLLQPNGLLAWHWDDGRVTGAQPATDADLDAAWALVLAGRRFSSRSDRQAGARLSAAILAGETETYDGRRTSVAGPWAVGPAPVLNPSYDAPLDMAALARLGGPSAAWKAIAVIDRQQMGELLQGGHLPSDWAILDAAGVAHPTAPPGAAGQSVVYGYDAVRVPVRLASSCSPTDRSMAAAIWDDLRRQVSGRGALVDLDLGGSPTQAVASTQPVGLVGAAAAAAAAGNRRAERYLFDEAALADRRHPSYYGTAWVALASVLFETPLLGGCGQRAG